MDSHTRPARPTPSLEDELDLANPMSRLLDGDADMANPRLAQQQTQLLEADLEQLQAIDSHDNDGPDAPSPTPADDDDWYHFKSEGVHIKISSQLLGRFT